MKVFGEKSLVNLLVELVQICIGRTIWQILVGETPLTHQIHTKLSSRTFQVYGMYSKIYIYTWYVQYD